MPHDSSVGIISDDQNMFTNMSLDEVEQRAGRPMGMSKDESKKIKEAIAEIVELSKGGASDRTDAAMMLKDLEGSLPEGQRWIVREHMANVVADETKNIVKGGVDNKKLDILRKHIRTGAGLAAIKAGAGLFQVVDGAMKLNNLETPEFPAEYKKSANLQDEIRKTKVRADQGDSRLEQMYKDMLAEDQAVTDDRARASGSIGQYGANIQAGASRRTDAMRKFADDAYKRKSQERSRLDDLTAMDIRENQNVQKDKWRRHYYESRDDLYSRSRLGNQINSGLNNIFTGLNEGADYLPYLDSDALAVEKAQDVNAVHKDKYDSEPIDPYPSRSAYPSASPQAPGVIPQVEYNLLGSNTTRHPALIERYQNILMRQGVDLSDEYGEWGHKTKSAWEKGMGSQLGVGWDTDGMMKHNVY